MGRTTALTAFLALVLAACGGAGAAAAPTAAQLARKLPGCHKPFTPSGGVAVQAVTEQECITPAAEVTVATFASAALERQWITANLGSGCGDVQGNGWAAEVGVTVDETGCPVEVAVAKALGGRLASG